MITVAPDGASAQGRWRTVIMAGEYGKSASWGEGTYENEYVNDGGIWKIRTERPDTGRVNRGQPSYLPSCSTCASALKRRGQAGSRR